MDSVCGNALMVGVSAANGIKEWFILMAIRLVKRLRVDNK